MILISIILTLIAAGGIVTYFLVPRTLANTLLRPNRQKMVKNPGDYGMRYENVAIQTEDGVTLAGWYIKGSGDNVIVIGHPVCFTKYGYSPAEETGLARTGFDRDVEFLPAAKHLVDAGYSVVMYDQRNHGESGASPAGIHDPSESYYDPLGVVKWVSRHPDLKGKDIGLLSFCQSAFITMTAMTQSPDFLKKAGVKAFAAIQPIATEIFYRNFLPSWIANRIVGIHEKLGLPLDNHNPVHYAGNIFIPTLFVQNLNDPWSDIDHSKEIYNKIPAKKEALWIDDKETHRFITYNWFNHHPERMLEFFAKTLS